MSEWWTYSLQDFLLFSPRTYYRLFALYNEALWLWIAWAFHAERFATINWAAIYYAYAFVLQAALLLWFALVTPPSEEARSASSPIALGVAIFAIFLQPAIGPLLGRDWHQAEVFGLTPDPTAVATLALLAMQPRAPCLLLIIPTLWCVMTGLTLWTMQTPDAWVTPVAGALALLTAAWKTPRHETR